MSDADPALAALKPCGCLVAVTVDLPEYREDVAEDVADWIRRGHEVHRMTVAEARAKPWVLGGGGCDHDEQRAGEALGQEVSS